MFSFTFPSAIPYSLQNQNSTLRSYNRLCKKIVTN